MTDEPKTPGERLKEIRNVLSMTQAEMADSLGIKRTTVARIEVGINPFTEQMLRSVSSMFNVNYFWLRDGIGDMFESVPKGLIDQLARMYQLTDLEVRIISAYLLLPDKKKAVFRDFLNTVLKDGDR